MEGKIERLGLGAHVLLAGFVRPVAPLLQRATLVVMPSLFEPLGMAQVEALILRVPVVASRVDGIPETVDHRRTGLLADPGDARAWYAEVCWALDHPKDMREMAEAGRADALARFSPEAHMGRFVEILEGKAH